MEDIRFTEAPKSSDRSELAAALTAFNSRATGHEGGVELASFVREDGRLIAGICGWVWGRTAQVDMLWVDEDHRKKGLGTTLLRRFEREAKDRGSLQNVLTTASFQAPDFYKGHGYEVVGEISEHPQDHTEFILRKRL